MATNRRQFIKLSTVGLGAFLLGPRAAAAWSHQAWRRPRGAWRAAQAGGLLREDLGVGAESSPGRLFLCSDDGYSSDVWLAEQIQKRGLTGSLFVHTRQVSRQGRLSWADIEALGRELDVCSHGVVGGHYTQLGDAELKDYLLSARLDLEAHGRGQDARVFGPPNDDMDSRVRKAALDAGYEMIRSKTPYRLLPGIAEFEMWGVSNRKSEAFLLQWLAWCAAGPATRGLAMVFHRIVPSDPVGTECDEARALWLLDRAVESPCPKLRFTDLPQPQPPIDPGNEVAAFLPQALTRTADR